MLDVRDLVIQFDTHRGSVTAVDRISFSLNAGKTLCIVGESGCGKSVTALALMGLLSPKTARVSGSMIFENQDLLTMEPSQRRAIRGHRIAMIFQEPMTSLNPVMTVGAQVAESLEIHRREMDRTKREARVKELFEWVGIPFGHRSDYPHELSGGMRQRIMIAMALALEPKILIADEPTTALDVTIQAQILELLMRLKAKLGMGVILITHDLGIVYEVGDDVIVMYAGKVVERALATRLFAEPLHPYTQGLLTCLPAAAPARVVGIPGQVPSLYDLPRGCYFQDRCFLAVSRCGDAFPPLEKKRADHEVACIEVIRETG